MEPEDEIGTQKSLYLNNEHESSVIDEATIMRNLFYLDDDQNRDTERRLTYHNNVGDVTHKTMNYHCVGKGPNSQIIVDLVDFVTKGKSRSLIYLQIIPNTKMSESTPSQAVSHDVKALSCQQMYTSFDQMYNKVTETFI